MDKRRPRVFYGWWIVGALFIMETLRSGFIGHGFTAFFEPIVDELGWSYVQVSFAASLRGVEVGLLAPVMGILVDRFGPRRLMFIGVIILAAGMLFLSRTSSLVTFYAAFALIAIGMSTLTRTVSGASVANWFHTKLGLATGITVCGVGFGGFMLPISARLVDSLGWRESMAIFSLGVLVLLLPLSLVIRHKPEHYGYLPDGKADDIENAVEEKTPDIKEADFSAKQALKSRSFWLIGLPFLVHRMLQGAVSLHVMPYLSSVGVSRSIASLVAMGIPVASMIGRFGLGFFSTIFQGNKKWLIAACLVLEILSMLLFANITGSTLIFTIFILLQGIGWGGLVPMRSVILREYFGLINFGTILGFLIGFEVLGALLGAPLAGWVYDKMGSYQTIWLIFAGLALLGVIVVLNLPDSRRQHSS
ncbi:MFS transporter [Chloroflexota bacterium]